jgi:hypothetical protein
MGGFGSGRWQAHAKADTVEDCQVLDVTRLAREKLFSPLRQGTLRWTSQATGKVVSSVGFATRTPREGRMFFVLQYRITRTGEAVDLPIELQTTRPHLGGVRWWFTCPLAAGRPCDRRVGKLYLPPGGKYFGCRRCHNLTYRSAQEHDKRLDALLRNPQELGALWEEASRELSTLRGLGKVHLLIKADALLQRRLWRHKGVVAS